MSRRPPPSSSWPQNSALQPHGTTATSQSTEASALSLHMCCSLSYKALSQPLAWPIPQLSCQEGFLTLLLQFIPSSLCPFQGQRQHQNHYHQTSVGCVQPVKLFVVRSFISLTLAITLQGRDHHLCGTGDEMEAQRGAVRYVRLAHSRTVSKWVRSVPDLWVHSPSSWTEVRRQWPCECPCTTLAYPTPGTYGTLPVKLMPQRCSELVTVSPNVGPSAGTNWMMLGGRPAFRRIRYTA